MASPILNIPYDIMKEMVRRMSVQSFRALAETCKRFQELWNNDSLWKDLLLRDFKVEAVHDAEKTDRSSRYKDTYKSRFEQRKEEMRCQHVVYPDPHPPPGVMDPYSNYQPPTVPGGIPGMVGGAYDLNPAGAFPGVYPYGNWPYPGNVPYSPLYPGAPRQPFGPRIRPVTPFDPDAGLFGPPGRHPRPRNPFGGGGNPFGGGPSFPGGRFL